MGDAVLDDAFLDALAAHGPIGKTLGMLIRPAFIADPGKTFVWCDWAAIEARVLPWLAGSPGAERKLDVFRASDADHTKPDVYIDGAAGFIGVDPQELWFRYLDGETEAKKLRQSHGKVPELSLGFGGSLGALLKMAINYGVYFTEEQGLEMVKGWRARNEWAPAFWGSFRVDKYGNITASGGLWGAINMALRNPKEAFAAGRVAYVFDPDYMKGTLFCGLPNGGMLTYPGAKYSTKSFKNKDTDEVEEKHALWYRKQYGYSAMWHGKAAENITQAVAGRILRETLVILDREFEDWMPVVGHTHDEIVCEPSDKEVERAKRVLYDTMLKPAPWRLDLPLAAEVSACEYYTKDPSI
jgi:DNA polymerase